MSTNLDVFGGASTQDLGMEIGEGVVYSVSLKRVRYGNHSGDHPDGHLLWNSQKVRTLRAGTVEKLIEHLSPLGESVDVSYRMSFLSTYRMFTSADLLVQLLVQRFNAMESSDDNMTENANKTAVQSHIVSFLCLWLETHQMDFFSPPSHPLLTLLHPLTLPSNILHRAVESLRQEFKAKEISQMVGSRSSMYSEGDVFSASGGISDDGDISWSEENDCSSSGSCSNFDLCTLDPDQFAGCLTSKDAALFKGIVPHQCLDYIRQPRDTENALSVRSCIEHFNRVSLVVMATILDSPDCEGRRVTIERWIDIAHQCRALKNFSSLKAIISGLQSSSVYRLKKTWESVESSKETLFQELAGLFAADDNHQMSRDLLSREGTAKYADMSTKKNKRKSGAGNSVHGVVPYLGMFLTDLTMLNSANKDHTEGGLVNFDKCRKLFEVLIQLNLYQKSAANYKIPANRRLERWLKSSDSYTQKESYQLSLALEPQDDSPSLLSLPPSRIRQTLTHLFTSKGTIVSDVLSSKGLSLSPSTAKRTLAKSVYSNRFLSTKGTYDVTNGGRHEKRKRSNSLSPTIERKTSIRMDEDHVIGDEPIIQPLHGHVIKVAMTTSDYCNYNCLLLGENDKASTVIQKAISKLSVKGSPADYCLAQVVEGKRTVEIPHDANVYYALSTTNSKTEAIKATLHLLEKQTL